MDKHASPIYEFNGFRLIPAERLLVYTVGDGWGPLCKFLSVPVPSEPYPSENSRADFIANFKKAPGSH